jgi:mRNA-degrading endonuclease RelE of RelBE toxin-antitoxin system
MTKLKIIRAAFREIQKLSPVPLQIVCEILRRLSQGDDRHSKSLQGYENLRRTRLGDVRVIWQRVDSDSIVVIKAGLRGDVYDHAFDRRDRTDPRMVEELLNPQGTSLAENPAYEWKQVTDEENWYKFVYGGYQYSPVLTQYQRAALAELTQQWQSVSSHKAWLVQSAPGTGKTVCAAMLACELHQEYGWNTMLVVPESLRRDIGEYSEVKRLIQLQKKGFCLCSFRECLGIIAPDLYQRLLTPQQELQILQGAASRARQAGFLRGKLEKIEPADVLLYQAFVLDTTNHNQAKHALYKKNEQQILNLKLINHSFWERELYARKLAHHLCRVDVANYLKLSPPIPPNYGEHTVFIIDEAQDFLLAELQALQAVSVAWNHLGHNTYLWLLGDLNQRIQPTDFLWGQLEMGKPTFLLRNYRNSRYILEFANQFLQLAKQENYKLGGKHKEIPEPAKPEYAVEVGEPVRLLKCASPEEALKFIDLLNQISLETSDERHFLKKLANRIKVFWHNHPQKYCNYNSIEILNAEQAKGREFEACVAFRIFEQQSTKAPSLEECFCWYTLLTRSRSRLLVVATNADLQRLNIAGYNFFQNCVEIDANQAVNWITEVASGVDFSQFREDKKNIQKQLLQACSQGCPYWDTYLALQAARVEGDRLYQWEQQAIRCLQQHSMQQLNAELNEAQNISLRCLLLRAMNCSWYAVEEAAKLRQSDLQEYERLLTSIAQDLHSKNLPYEAARVLTRLGRDLPPEYPFQEIAQQSGSLVSLLCQNIISRSFPDMNSDENI